MVPSALQTMPEPGGITVPQLRVPAQVKKGKQERDPDEDPIKYSSTWEHRVWVWSTIGLLIATAVAGAGKVDDLPSFSAALLAAVGAYYLSDLLTGIYHWSVDNYGDGNTPVVGEQIAAFQGHHREPWTITERQFCNNVHKVFKPALPFAAMCLLASHWLPAWMDIGLSLGTGLTCMSQQFHAWSHMKRSQLPQSVIALQDASVLVSRKVHCAHHIAPFEGNYCIVSGACNPLLDQSGFFRSLENLVHKQTGVEPRCWQPSDSPIFDK